VLLGLRRRPPAATIGGMTFAQRLARLTTALVVRSPRLWWLLRAPFRRYFDRLAPRWDGIAGAGHLDALWLALDRVAPPRCAIDVGTGTGLAALLLAERFPDADVIGIDVSHAMIAAAERKRSHELADRLRFLAADAAMLPVAAGSCDLVTLVNMIPFYDELARVLAPAGTLLVSYSEGSRTPIWVPSARLRRELACRGLTEFAEFAAGEATCLLARRPTGSTVR
jgi:SAM-dependent methyltransferase